MLAQREYSCPGASMGVFLEPAWLEVFGRSQRFEQSIFFMFYIYMSAVQSVPRLIDATW